MKDRTFPHPALRIVLSAGLGATLALPVLGQDYELVAPKAPAAPARAPQLVSPPASTPALVAPGRVILEKLRGLRFVDSAAKLVRTGVPGAGVTVEDLPLLEDQAIRAKLASFLGTKLTFGGLNAISQTIVAWYRDHGRPFVDVTFPEQDVSAGLVQGVVSEFRVGAIRVQGNQWFSSEFLRDQIRLAPGDPIDAPHLQEDIAWLNQNPFRQVDVVAEKGAAPGTTDLVLQTQDRLPFRVYAGYDNTGTPVLGHDRWNLGFNWGNAFWLDQQFSYQFTSSDDFWHSREKLPGRPDNPSFTAHAVSYVAPLPWRDKITIFGSYEEAVPRLGPDIGVTGVSGQASIRYILSLPRGPSVAQQLSFGYDYKTSNNNLEFGGTVVSAVATEINQFPLVYDLTVTDGFGQTSVENTLVFSPGNLTGSDKDALFQAQSASPFAKARYVYDTVRLTRTTRLPSDASWVMRVVGQTSDRDLLPSEQLGAGGYDSVRGYDERVANGSQGLLLSEELRTPAFSLAKLVAGRAIDDQAQLLAFWDYGSVREKQPVPGESTSVSLESVGMGMRYAITRYLDFRLDYGWQLRKLPGVAVRGQMGHIGITLSY
jgi:hemolysin activation/secretion protein